MSYMTYEFRQQDIAPEIIDEMEEWLDINAGWGKYYVWRSSVLLIGDNLTYSVFVSVDEKEIAALFKLRFGL